MIREGQVYALNELADEYEPKFYDVANPATLSWYTKQDGNVYCYPNSSCTPDDLEKYENIYSNQNFLVRQDIYEALGCPDMSTQEGFVAAVKKAAELYPEVDGQPLIPIGADEFTEKGCNSFGLYLQDFLAVPYEKDGEYYERCTDSDYLSWLKVFRQLGQEGYLKDDIFIDKRSQLEEKIAEGRYFCLFYQSSDITDQQKILSATHPERSYIAVDGPKNSAGDDPVLPVVGVNGWTITFISKNCKDPETAIKFLTYLMSEEGQKMAYLGVEGSMYEMEDGKPVEKQEILDLLNSDRSAYDKKYGADNTYWMMQNNVMQLDWDYNPEDAIGQMNKIKDTFYKLKLNQKFTIVILILVMVPFFLFFSVLFGNMEENAISQAISDSTSQVRDLYNTVQKTVELCNMSTQSFLNNQDLKDFLVKLRDEDSISTEEYLEFDRNDIAMLERLVNCNPYLYQICVYAFNNDFPEMIPILYHQNRMESLPWAKDYESGKWQFDYPDGVQSNSSMNASQHLMSLVSNVEDDDGEPAGVIEVAVSMDDIFPVLFSPDEENWACFIGKDGKVYQSEEESTKEIWNGIDEQILEQAEQAAGPQVIHTSIWGRNMILAVQPMKELSGVYVQVTSIQEQMDSIAFQKTLMAAGMVLIFALLCVIINGIVKALLKRFYGTLKVIHQVQDGNLDIRVHSTIPDEMGDLGNQVDKMLDRIQQLMKENVDREILIRNTEVKALQNQINAHFIYNVLECVKMMAEIDEEYEISDAVTALGELLRYSMKWFAGNVRISDELQYIRNYIALMNLRYDFTITLSVQIPEMIEIQEIPKMSLQPIVENAIIHGIEENDEDAVISIKAVVREKDFAIEITDSGKGMNQEELELLYKKMNGEVEVSGGSGNGIGLKNVQDRIHMEFGEGYGLSFAAKEGCYTKVTVTLPITKKQGDRK